MDRGAGRGVDSDTRADTWHRRAIGPAGVLLITLVLAAAVVPLGVAAQSASVSITVEGDTVESGGQVTVTKDPQIGVDLEADAAIETVVLRVNGDTVETYAPDEATASLSPVLDLVDGDNEVTVIMETESDEVVSRTITVTKDDRAPFIRFTAPFETGHHRDVIPNATTVNGTYVTVSGEIHDASTVTHVTITREFTYSHGNVPFFSKDRWDIESPGGSFAQPIFLGDGSNTVKVRVEDSLGYGREYNVNVTVNDTTKPTVDFQLPDESYGSTVPLDGQVDDNSQLDAVSVEVGDHFGPVNVFDGVDAKPERNARSVRLSETVELREGENLVVVTATDLSGNTVEANHTVVYTRSVTPNLRFYRDETAVDGDGTVAVRGIVEDGEITGVTLESVSTDSGEVVDFVRVYDGSIVRQEVEFDETLQLGDGETRVVARYTDSADEEHRRSFLVDRATGTIRWVEPEPAAADSGNESTDGTANESDDGSGDGSSAGGSDAATTTAPPSDDGMMSALPLPGFTGVTAAIAMGVIALLAAVGRRRTD